MDINYFFNYDKLYSEFDDFDLNEQRLSEYNEEEQHKWGLNFEIKLVEINKKVTEDNQFAGLSQLKDEIENSDDESESIDLSEISNDQNIIEIGTNKEPRHFITKIAFEDRFIELV